jgi:hypothetical protein
MVTWLLGDVKNLRITIEEGRNLKVLCVTFYRVVGKEAYPYKLGEIPEGTPELRV